MFNLRALNKCDPFTMLKKIQKNQVSLIDPPDFYLYKFWDTPCHEN